MILNIFTVSRLVSVAQFSTLLSFPNFINFVQILRYFRFKISSTLLYDLYITYFTELVNWWTERSKSWISHTDVIYSCRVYFQPTLQPSSCYWPNGFFSLPCPKYMPITVYIYCLRNLLRIGSTEKKNLAKRLPLIWFWKTWQSKLSNSCQMYNKLEIIVFHNFLCLIYWKLHEEIQNFFWKSDP